MPSLFYTLSLHDALPIFVKDAILPVFGSVVSLVAFFTVLWRFDATLTLLALAVVPYMMLVFWFYAEPMMERSYQQQEIEGKIRSEEHTSELQSRRDLVCRPCSTLFLYTTLFRSS